MTIRPCGANATAILYGFRTTGDDGAPMWVALFAIGAVVVNPQAAPAANDP